jgi:uncharacterized protein YjiS (DUF1127 family)
MTYVPTVQAQHDYRNAPFKEVSMMAQPIQTFESLTSETTTAGGNALSKTNLSHEDRRLIEMNARAARAVVIADRLSAAVAWFTSQTKNLLASLKADLRLRRAEAQLFRMSDRELADLGLCRADIPFAVREAAADEAAAGESPMISASATSPAANQNLRRHVAA